MKGEVCGTVRRFVLWWGGSALLGLPLTSNFLQGDGQAYYALTEAMYVHGGRPDLDSELYLKLVTHRVFFFDYDTGRWVSPVSFGHALVQIPFLWVADRWLERLPPVRDYGWLRFAHVPIPWSRVLGLWFSGVTALAIYLSVLDGLWLRTAGRGRRDGAWAGFMAAGVVVAPVLPYTLLSPAMPHAWEAAGAAIALSTLVRLVGPQDEPLGSRRWWAWAGLGFVAGWLVSVRVINAAGVVGAVLWALRPRRGWASRVRQFGSRGFALAVGLLPWAVAVLAYNRWAYGHVFRTGYGAGLFVWALPLPELLKTYGLLLGRYLLHPGHGLWAWSPVALLGLIGLVRWARREGRDHPAAYGLAAWVAFWGALATYKIWWGDFTVGPRFFVVGAPWTAYGLIAWFRDPVRWAWVRRVGAGGMVLGTLYSWVLYWGLSAWSAHGIPVRGTEPVIAWTGRVLGEMGRVVQARPAALGKLVEPAPPWTTMAHLLGDRPFAEYARGIRLVGTGPAAYDPHRSLLHLPLGVVLPDVPERVPGYLLLRVFRGDVERPHFPTDWVVFLQLGPMAALEGVEGVTVDFLLWGATVTPFRPVPALHYRWNPLYPGRVFPSRLRICAAYQPETRTAFDLGCFDRGVVPGALGAPVFTYHVLFHSPGDPVVVEPPAGRPLPVRIEVRTLRGHRVLEPRVPTVYPPGLNLGRFLGPALRFQEGTFRGPLVVTVTAGEPIRIHGRPSPSSG